jgi:RNA polymerase sigma factor (TIGR02999 family)
MPPYRDITRILAGWEENPRAALEELSPLVYSELRRLAASYLRRERPGHTLQPTALVHEAYLRMVDQKLSGLQHRGHFFGVAARLMRQILVDSARQHSADKRCYGKQIPLDERVAFSSESAGQFLELNEALDKLQVWDERKCQVIEMRYLAGLKLEEIAEVMGIGLATVKRDLAMAEAFLRREMASGAETADRPRS